MYGTIKQPLINMSGLHGGFKGDRISFFKVSYIITRVQNVRGVRKIYEGSSK